MSTFSTTAITAMLLLSAVAPATAFPVEQASSNSDVTLVAGGCGPAFHRGPLGGCRPNGVVAVVRRPICRMVLLPLPHRVCR